MHVIVAVTLLVKMARRVLQNTHLGPDIGLKIRIRYPRDDIGVPRIIGMSAMLRNQIIDAGKQLPPERLLGFRQNPGKEALPQLADRLLVKLIAARAERLVSCALSFQHMLR